jgi:nucleotidyltransferase/DNA polymerase involved in DNA repair
LADRITLAEHARLWAARRGIDEATVLEVARKPEQRIEITAQREVRQSRVLDQVSGKLRLVRVFVDRGVDEETVVTVYRTSKLRKYWREQ